jgi:hypothetical protein
MKLQVPQNGEVKVKVISWKVVTFQEITFTVLTAN